MMITCVHAYVTIFSPLSLFTSRCFSVPVEQLEFDGDNTATNNYSFSISPRISISVNHYTTTYPYIFGFITPMYNI